MAHKCIYYNVVQIPIFCWQKPINWTKLPKLTKDFQANQYQHYQLLRFNPKSIQINKLSSKEDLKQQEVIVGFLSSYRSQKNSYTPSIKSSQKSNTLHLSSFPQTTAKTHIQKSLFPSHITLIHQPECKQELNL